MSGGGPAWPAPPPRRRGGCLSSGGPGRFGRQGGAVRGALGEKPCPALQRCGSAEEVADLAAELRLFSCCLLV